MKLRYEVRLRAPGMTKEVVAQVATIDVAAAIQSGYATAVRDAPLFSIPIGTTVELYDRETRALL